MTDEQLHELARDAASRLVDPDRKQLRFNEIVAAARRYYAADLAGGVREIVAACDRANEAMYVRHSPMWGDAMARNWGWAFPASEG